MTSETMHLLAASQLHKKKKHAYWAFDCCPGHAQEESYLQFYCFCIVAFTARAFTYAMHLLNKCLSNVPAAAIQCFFVCLIILHAPTYFRCNAPSEKFCLFPGPFKCLSRTKAFLRLSTLLFIFLTTLLSTQRSVMHM